MDTRHLLLGVFLAAGSFGCGQAPSEPLPKTYKVEGKILKKGQPYSGGGVIEFIADGKRSLGDIQPDGTFLLRTVTAQHNVAGASEGQHAVTILPASKDQSAAPISLKKKYAVTAGDNQLTILVE